MAMMIASSAVSRNAYISAFDQPGDRLPTLSLGLSSYFQCSIKSTATQAFFPSAYPVIIREGHTTATKAPEAPTEGIPTRLKFPPRTLPNKPPAK
jgi:hypothetical protein